MEAVRTGTISINAAATVATLPAEEQEAEEPMESFPQYTQAILDRINAVIDGKPEAARFFSGHPGDLQAFRMGVDDRQGAPPNRAGGPENGDTLGQAGPL